ASACAIPALVHGRRRGGSIRRTWARRSRCGERRGRDDRSTRPEAPSTRQRRTHLATVRSLTPNAAATATCRTPCPTTRSANRARPAGVNLAFLWTFTEASEELTGFSTTPASLFAPQ